MKCKSAIITSFYRVYKFLELLEFIPFILGAVPANFPETFSRWTSLHSENKEKFKLGLACLRCWSLLVPGIMRLFLFQASELWFCDDIGNTRFHIESRVVLWKFGNIKLSRSRLLLLRRVTSEWESSNKSWLRLVRLGW